MDKAIVAMMWKQLCTTVQTEAQNYGPTAVAQAKEFAALAVPTNQTALMERQTLASHIQAMWNNATIAKNSTDNMIRASQNLTVRATARSHQKNNAMRQAMANKKRPR